MTDSFEGIQWKLCNNWFNFIKVDKNKPINYLEIGTLCGANLFSVAKEYGFHNDSKLHCIDPWLKYNDYDENYEQEDNYNKFVKNLENSSHKHKIVVHRGFSHIEVPKLYDDYFDTNASMRDLARKYEITLKSMQKLIKKYQIPKTKMKIKGE